MEDLNKGGLPENAMRELKPGEEYKPLMSAESNPREVTPYSIVVGVLMTVLFSAASAYLGLKVGQVFEAAIPIAIIAVGFSTVFTKLFRNSPLGQNVMIQSIGACSGMIVAGAIFTLPALYILHLQVNFLQVFLASLLGGVLGILFIIPFRRYFVKDMHGKYPFPEATASTQVLVSGAKGGNSAKPLLIAGIIGGLYDFVVATFGLWNEDFTSRAIGWGATLADKWKLVFKMNTGAAVLGMGYIVGFKYALIICLGSVCIWWLFIPGISALLPTLVIDDSGTQAAAASAEQLFTYCRSIGIGGIAMAGIIGILKSWKIIYGAIGLTARELGGKKSTDQNVPRTQKDISMRIVAIVAISTLIITFLFLHFGVMGSIWKFSLVAILIVTLITFLFTTVSANAIAIVGSNPVSGMTLMTLILASVIMVAVGLKGEQGMVATLIMGGVVCTALSTAGAFITDLKIGYWLGSTPRKQETWKFLGTLISAATVAGVIMILNQAYGFEDGRLAAPQANAMAAVIEPLMSGKGAPWALYGIGAAIAVLLTLFDVSALAFALGMFIPLQLNIPILVGGAINWFVTTRSKDKAVNDARGERGTLLSSGFIAGGALMGVLSAALSFMGISFDYSNWWANPASELLSLGMCCMLVIYLIRASMRAK